MRPEEARREIKRLEDERLRLVPEVAEDRRLEERIRELSGSGRRRHLDGAIEPGRTDCP